MEKEFLTIKEAAEVFNVHQNTIYAWIKKGFIVSIRIGDKKKSPYRLSRRAVEQVHKAILIEMSKKSQKG
jgi:excisionase family DNA binding protein